MKYKDLHLSKQVSIKGHLYSISSIKTHGRGPLAGCTTYYFSPIGHNGDRLIAFQWEDGEIYGLKKAIEPTKLDSAAYYNPKEEKSIQYKNYNYKSHDLYSDYCFGYKKFYSYK